MTVPGMLGRDALRAAIEAGEVDTVVTAFPDLYGRLVGKRITGHFFASEVMDGGMHACDYLLACDMEMDPTPGYAYTSWQTGYGDLHAVPDFSSLRWLAWHERTALVLCDCVEDDGSLVAVAPRSILKRQLARAAEAGYRVMTGSELEFFLFTDSYATAREKGYADLATTQHYVEDYHVLSSTFAEPVIGAIRKAMDASGVPVEFSKGEWGPGQHEINLRYAEALAMADRHVVYKLGAKEIAASLGHGLTFMAKFDESLAGNSLHVHSSLALPDGTAALRSGWNDARRDPCRSARRLSPLVGRAPGTRARAVALLRTDREQLQALCARDLRADRHRVELGQPHCGVPSGGEGRLAARGVSDPGGRREPLPGLCGPGRRRAGRYRAPARPRPCIRRRRLSGRGA